MKTLTIRLSDALAERIENESLTRRVSKSEVVRERLAQPQLDAPAAGQLREILEAAWSAKVPARSRPLPSEKKQKLAEIIRAKKLHR